MHECTFRVDRYTDGQLHLGIVRSDKIDHPRHICDYGYTYKALDGKFFSTTATDPTDHFFPTTTTSWTHKSFGASRYMAGDTVTVRVDLEVNTISFKKNGANAGTPQDIPHKSYYYAFESYSRNQAVTIVEREMY